MGGQIFDGGSDSGSDDIPQIKINEEYARRYEYNKKREDLQRYEELKKRGLVSDPSGNSDSDSESSSSEYDEEELVADSDLLEALIKVKNRDPSLKNKDVQLFKPDGDKTRVKEDGKTKKKKKMYLKDVNAKHLIEEGPELAENEEERVDYDNTATKSKIYDEEQEQRRREFLKAVAADGDEDDDGDFLIEKDKNALENDDEDDDNVELDQKFNECFPDSDENALFLKEYLKKKMWESETGPEVRDEDLEVSEDDILLERQEEYEHRFQENAGDQILGHSRQVEGSVRKKVKARKEQRKSKEDRMEIARLEREEELRHLKNLKKKENNEKLKKIMEIAGIKDDDLSSFDVKELEKEFDPQEYDRMMNKAFGEEYYEAEDELEFGSDMDEDAGETEKPDFDKEDELLGLPKGWENDGSGDGFLAVREKVLKRKKESVGEEEEEEEEEEEGQEEEEEEEEEGQEEVDEEDKQEKKRKLALLERVKNEMMDEYYKLDYEDTIGDLKTRFKYAKIKPNRYGLTTAELLLMDEKELNQYVSLKKLAPYTEKEWKIPNNKRNEIKQKVKEIFRQGKAGKKKNHKKQRISDEANDSKLSMGATGQLSKEPSTGDDAKDSSLSRSARRRRLQAAKKLPASRLMAYGVMPVKSKKKGKH